MRRTSIPEHYMMMLDRFKTGIDPTREPRLAFKTGTPKWMVDEWVEFNMESVNIC